LSVAASAVMEFLVNKYLDKRCYRFIQGGIPETTKVLEQKFDHIIYTGNGMVAKIVMSAASKWLCPVTLELGGQCPVFIDSNNDINTVARRIAWAKFLNTGQTCIAPNHVFVERSQYQPFLDAMAKHTKDFYGEDPKASPDYGRIISTNHWRRLMKMLNAQVDSGNGKVVVGGVGDEAEKYIAPTVIALDNADDKANPILGGELFGPFLPVIPYDNIEEGLKWVKAHDHPLASYAFSTDSKYVERIKNEVHSGGFVGNDCMYLFLQGAY
jgi:acyl-CoA reductase-like NAD-dependent aldehyde dehydrogenase